ncbi:MAG: TonB-dependent receptor [Flavobacteriales bacterium]|nr:TonB-dependent receptor [Flavobacteriales bacterium]
MLPLLLTAQPGTVHGRVADAQGPLPFAGIVLKDGSQATASDADGRFTLTDVPAGPGRLVVSAMGMATRELSFTLPPGGTKDLGTIILDAAYEELEEVVVTGTMREVSRSESPVPVEVITSALFRRNPSPALFDAVGMVNGVRPQINCSVCNTGDIHINGMEGPYTMVLIDGMPIVSGLSTVYGLSGIPNSLVERVEVVKGPGSALYGSEAMGGIINVITKDPVLAPRFSADLFGTTWNEWNGDLGLGMGKGRARDLLGVNIFRYNDPRDRNADGFTDVTLQERISIFNKFDLQRADHRLASLAARYVTEDRWGGQMEWTEADKGSDKIYGESIHTERWELIGQYQLPLRERVITQFSFNSHQQDSWYGTMPYRADQRVFFAQAHWARALGARHDLLLGAAYRHTWYDDNTVATATAAQRIPLPGLFVQDEWALADVHKLLLGYRVDHDRAHGLVHSPRLAYKWAPNGRWAVRASFGTGYRVVNLFTEDHAALTGARQVVIAEELKPERSTNATLNLVRKWPAEKRFFGIDLSLFHTRFSNRILPDYQLDPNLIVYDNLHGFGISQGASLNLEARIGKGLRGMAGVTWMDVYTKERDPEGRMQRQDQYFAPAWSGTFTLSQTVGQHWTIDLTGQWSGPMRLPVLPNDYRSELSPTYALVNLQVKRAFGRRFELYGGVKNLLDFVPSDPLMRPFDPFDHQADDPVSNPYGYTFDTSYMYAPLQGARGFLGLRFTLAE